MNTYAIYEISTGEIVCLYRGADPSLQIQDGQNYVQCDPDTRQETHWVNNGGLTEYSDNEKALKAKEWFVGESWSNSTMSWQVDDSDLLRSEIAKEVRAKRNVLLAQSDYTQMPDVVLSNQDEWDSYRQALRDLPANNASALSTDDIVWPTPPSTSG